MIEPALYREIIAQPLDDEPRLVLADWLEERGDVRGEFIRVQCQLHSGVSLSGEPLSAADRARLARQQRQMQPEAEALWRQETETLASLEKLRFVRGMPGHAALTLSDFCSSGEAICNAIPLQSVALTHRGGPLPSNLDVPWLRHLAAIEFTKIEFPSETLRTFFASEHVGRLQSLSFSSSRIASADMRALAATTGMPSLRKLRLHNNHGFDGPDLDQLMSGVALRGLASFAVSRTLIRPAILRHACFSRSLRTLSIEGLVGWTLSDSWIGELLRRANQFPRLEKLVLNRAYVTNHGFTELVTADPFPRLRTLGVNNGTIHDEGAFVFAASEMIGRLLDVRMSHNDLTDDGVRALWRSKNRPQRAKFYLPHQSGVGPFARRALREELGSFGSLL